jgi:ketosteroid isomerase-like protein
LKLDNLIGSNDMPQRFGYVVWLPILMLLLAFSPVRAQTSKAESIESIKKVSDSLMAIVKTALVQTDSALLSTVLIDTVGIVVTGPESFRGKQNVLKCFRQLMIKLGGGTFESSRDSLKMMPGKTDIANESGKYKITRKTEAGEQQLWKGLYSVFWNRHDSTWVPGRIFIGFR